ncbi:MAG: tRNA (adenosine(37)-N6)-dimethylallyltransferase MiaA [Limnobacter sp.]|nr:tRNA (adenosine(37)-N6)-dimethylallyltransferase MiaA [Limnobacter sp.]
MPDPAAPEPAPPAQLQTQAPSQPQPQPQPQPLVMLLGPTASGKSAVAMALAERLPIEIVSVDSALVYRGMDIGTAKPSADERRRVPHHLIDLIEPTDAYSAARFVSDARAAIAGIRARGALPLLVGGTMLYAKALVDGLHALPQADPALRMRIEDEARALGWPALHARLAKLDPRTAARLEPNDAQRIQRALEILELTGVPMSDWLERSAVEGRAAEPVVTIALEPSERSVLHERIARRFHAMLAAGFVDEVRALRARGDLHAALPSMRCVGYRQLWKWCEAGEPGGKAWSDTIAAGIAATRQLAKRQLTWLRAMPDRQTIDCLADGLVQRVFDAVRRATGT